MPAAESAANPRGQEWTRGMESIRQIAVAEYEPLACDVDILLHDVEALYLGHWASHEACRVGYHDFGHAVEVTLATVRMVAGWNRLHPDRRLTARLFCVAMGAALFHDSGYIKDKGDQVGAGGKYTFRHVERSRALASRYFSDMGWPAEDVELICRLIDSTDFQNGEAGIQESGNHEEVVGRMLASADIIAQMADVDYFLRMELLFEEFQEAYQHEPASFLEANNVQVYQSAQEIKDNTKTFYENFVLPRLEKNGWMNRYLAAFFGTGRNPYQENIAANISGYMLQNRSQWQRLGDVLVELGLLTDQQIEQAVERQRRQEEDRGRRQQQVAAEPAGEDCRHPHLPMAGGEAGKRRLGAILLEMKAIEPNALCQGLLSQILPAGILEKLSHSELIFLLRASMLLQHFDGGCGILRRILDMATDTLGCESAAILLADLPRQEMVVFLASDEEGDGPRRRFSMEKGLASWAFVHRKPATIDNRKQGAGGGKSFGSSDRPAHTIMAVPFHSDGEWMGAMEFLNKSDPSGFTEHDIDVVTALVNILGAALSASPFL